MLKKNKQRRENGTDCHLINVNEIANKLVSEFIGKDYLDYRTEISNRYYV